MGLRKGVLGAGGRPVVAALPAHWQVRRRRAGLYCLVLVTLLAALLMPLGAADELDGWWLRARFSLREALWPQGTDPQIVLALIDDKSVEAWKSQAINFPDDKRKANLDTSPRWAASIALAVAHLQRSGAAVIGLDWLQSVEFDEQMGVDDSQRLGTALYNGGVVLVKFIQPPDEGAGEAGLKYVLPAPSLRYALPGAHLDNGAGWMGFAEMVNTASIQTAIYPRISTPTGEEVSFAARIVEKSGLRPSPRQPLRPDGSLLVNYADGLGKSGAGAAFAQVSLVDLANQTRPEARWKGKIIIVGVSQKGNNDKHNVPFLQGLTGSRLVQGAELQANAVRTLLRGDGLWELPAMLVWMLASFLGSVGVLMYTHWAWKKANLGIGLLILASFGGSFLAFTLAQVALPIVVPLLCLLVGAGAMSAYRSLGEERERAEVMRIWGRHQDPRLISELLAHPEWRGGQGRELEVTVLFADLKNFTQTVESLAPAQALQALNRYLALLSSTILEHGGIVDKYLGDGLMAQWGAPAPRADHATAAVRACLALEERLAQTTAQLKQQGEVTFETRLTLHTGPVVAGPLGSEERLEYTIIGDTVNVTSRLQETAKALGCDFLISETTLQACADTLVLGREAEVAIRGRQQPLKVYEVQGTEPGPTAT